MDSLRKINCVSYLCSWEEMVETWVEIFHPEDHVLIIFDPLNHKTVLQNLGFNFDEMRLYSSKIGVLQLLDLDDGIWLLENMPKNGPYMQLWSLNNYISDNIDK